MTGVRRAPGVRKRPVPVCAGAPRAAASGSSRQPAQREEAEREGGDSRHDHGAEAAPLLRLALGEPFRVRRVERGALRLREHTGGHRLLRPGGRAEPEEVRHRRLRRGGRAERFDLDRPSR
ncbi:hypothetical protein GCM10010385_60660 [Streptomyces geysiriensis]|nr:hypothetical protein GCM10010385_60660 [Streptomyces geysiriensis]